MATKKTKYLSYIEEHRKHHSIIDEEAKISSLNAVNEAHDQSIRVTYLQGETIVRVKKREPRRKLALLKITEEKLPLEKKPNYQKNRRLRVFAGPNGSGK